MTEILEIKFSEEQAMLLEAATSFCKENSPTSQVRKLLETEQGFEPEIWQKMTELGWQGIIIPERFGGSDLSISDVVPIAEAMGETLMDTPFIQSLLATQALLDTASEGLKEFWLPKLVDGSAIGTMALCEENGSWDLSDIETEVIESNGELTLNGGKIFVQHATEADFIIVSCIHEKKPLLLLLNKEQIEGRFTREKVIDETRRSYRLDLQGLKINPQAMLTESETTVALKRLQSSALLLSAAEITGGIPGVMKVTLEYLNTRKQFGKLIGSYQALKHPMAEILCDYDYARSLLYHAATLFGSSEESDIALSLAKAHAGDTFLHAADRAVQFHGGFGFTYECDAQLFLRRASWCQYYFGDSQHHRTQLTELML